MMQFSSFFKQNNNVVEFSPCGNLLAAAISNKLYIRLIKCLSIKSIFSCINQIDSIEWSADSEYILCFSSKQSIVQVWSIDDPEWTCKIDESLLGLDKVMWSPDSRHILTSTSFNLKVTIWSLVNKSINYIKYPKAATPGLDFSHDGLYLAVAERRNCKDYLSIFVCSNWELAKHFRCGSKDLSGISWSPNEYVLCVWEGPLEEYSVILYSLSGDKLGSYEGGKLSLGVKCLSWSQSGQFLAVGGFDGKVKLLNSIICKKFIEFEQSGKLSADMKANVYIETQRHELSGGKESAILYEQLKEFPTDVPTYDIDLTKIDSKLGIRSAEFSCDNRYLFVINEKYKNTCWLYDIENLKLFAVLIQIDQIKNLCWHPLQAKLAICTSNENVYIWSPSSSSVMTMPNDESFQILSVRWNTYGDALMLSGNNNACLVYC